ncbi:SpoIIE family protein phosphatase [Streptacidiphilus sp. MAP12-20]|uniref:SpoIIE family protein phosphatase n=1 Tax=Streptacidiphilus sp. MAP12-20 TaxID=3156299 RepID=UPI003518CD98
MLSLALAAMMEEVDAHAGAVYLLDPDEPVLVMAVMAGLPRVFAAPWERVATAAPIPVADALRERGLVWVGSDEDMSSRYPRISVVLPYPFALAALPVATERTTYGAVFVTWPGSHPTVLADWERRSLTAACNRLALRLEHATMAGEPLHAEAGDLAVTPGSPGTPGSIEATRMVARLPHGLCALDLLGRVTYANPATAHLLGVPARRLLGTPLWSALPWLNDPVLEDRYRAALISQQPSTLTVEHPGHQWLTLRLYPSPDGITVHITPGLGPSHPEPDTPQLESSLEPKAPSSLVTIANVLTLASAMTETVSVQDVIDLVAGQIVPTIGGQALAMLAAEAGQLHVLGHRGYPDPAVVDRFEGMPLSAPTPGAHALATGTAGFYESRRELEEQYPARVPTPDGMAAWAYLPLIASGRSVGTCVFAYAKPHRFSDDERGILTSLGGLIAQALERAQLYDTKNQLAHGLQAALLPETLPRLPRLEVAARYLPATRGMDIGGDFYDLITTTGSRDGRDAAAVIGDVQGHNVTAAGLMGQVRTAVRAYTALGQSPDQVLASTNRLLLDLNSQLLASCLYLHLDTARHRAWAARAGHPLPLLRDPEGRVRVLDLPGGPLLGIDTAATYPVTEIALPPGSLLALYTDGLIEAPGVDLDAALAELARELSPAGALSLDLLSDALIRHHPDRPRSDDTALLLLRTKDSDQ